MFFTSLLWIFISSLLIDSKMSRNYYIYIRQTLSGYKLIWALKITDEVRRYLSQRMFRSGYHSVLYGPEIACLNMGRSASYKKQTQTVFFYKRSFMEDIFFSTSICHFITCERQAGYSMQRGYQQSELID